MKTNSCAIVGCSGRIKKGLLMCRTHWNQVPLPIQKSIQKNYKPGQNIHNASPAYMGALKAAIKAAKEQS